MFSEDHLEDGIWDVLLVIGTIFDLKKSVGKVALFIQTRRVGGLETICCWR